MPRLRPLQCRHVICIDFIVPRFNVEHEELPWMTGLHVCPDLLVVEHLPALDNLGTRVAWMRHSTALLSYGCVSKGRTFIALFSCNRSAAGLATESLVCA